MTVRTTFTILRVNYRFFSRRHLCFCSARGPSSPSVRQTERHQGRNKKPRRISASGPKDDVRSGVAFEQRVALREVLRSRFVTLGVLG